ncbi:hypothetical protein [Amycolatopsis sp. CA-230715]|uniref:hypothetical protein n=1 Tax=Amycolatopsis sp. CA-230715 TaxID=2745196 RepID=UPI001C0295BE|nr:hypothetical protein [Amycolatopsis sp. CA-230715]QWF84286.1 hypothetical protein HUW46_07736 [Amycolatopsis sp. CA-230715]
MTDDYHDRTASTFYTMQAFLIDCFADERHAIGEALETIVSCTEDLLFVIERIEHADVDTVPHVRRYRERVYSELTRAYRRDPHYDPVWDTNWPEFARPGHHEHG